MSYRGDRLVFAELYRCPSTVGDIRHGAIVRAGSALPSVYMGCTIYSPSCWNISRVHLLRDKSKIVRSPYAWLKTAPPSLPKVP